LKATPQKHRDTGATRISSLLKH